MIQVQKFRVQHHVLRSYAYFGDDIAPPKFFLKLKTISEKQFQNRKNPKTFLNFFCAYKPLSNRPFIADPKSCLLRCTSGAFLSRQGEGAAKYISRASLSLVSSRRHPAATIGAQQQTRLGHNFQRIQQQFQTSSKRGPKTKHQITIVE